MIGLGVAILETLACLGAGTAMLKAIGIWPALAQSERPAWAFAVGFGVVGWLLFPLALAGWLQPLALAGLLTVCAVGALPLIRRPSVALPKDLVGLTLLGAISLTSLFDVLEALAPPIDGDSLTYHFAMPKRFLEAGHLVFVPRAVDGAVPFLAQMTYVPVLGLGGEEAMTLWCMVSGWAASAFVYVLCRRFLDVNWSLLTALLFLTTPAVIYGGGSGQVEVRFALFVLGAAFAAAEALRTGNARFAVLAGILVGFYVAGKYTGLLLVPAVGLVLLAQRSWFRHGAAFGLAVLVTGFQWYVWNWINTGDPLFPLLFKWLGATGGTWDIAHDERFRASFFVGEIELPPTLGGFLWYPIAATFALSEKYESLRVGLGPFPLLVAPFALAGLWRFRDRLRASPLTPVAIVAFLFYAGWFFAGSPQRVRHLLPIYPLLLICLTVATATWAREVGAVRPLAAAAAFSVALQLAGHGLFSLIYMERLAKGEDRETFIDRHVTGGVIASSVNRMTGPADLILHGMRIEYLFDAPSYFTAGATQARFDAGAMADPRTTWPQAQALGATYIVLTTMREIDTAGLRLLAKALIEAGCAEVASEFPFRYSGSRTLPSFASDNKIATVVRITNRECRL